MAKNEESVKNSAFGFGVLNPYEKYFTGKSYLHGLAEGNGAKAHVAQVTFAPGTINHWHSHNLPQILIGTGGEGWVQKEGTEPIKMTEGTVVVIEAGTRHWHGAARDSWFSHLSVIVGDEDTNWQELVDQAFYESLR